MKLITPSKQSPLLTLALGSLLASFLFTACSSTNNKGGMTEDGTGVISDEDLALQNQNRFGDGNIPTAQGDGVFDDILFNYDSSAIASEYQEQIRQNAAMLARDTTLRVEVEGHCDRRGTNEYNMALGEERAKAVAAMMLSFGVKPEQINTVSYGEEIPVESGDSESAYARNRRAHFALYRYDQAQNSRQ